MLYQVVRATAEEVDWVFLGPVPNALARYAVEVHPLVPIDQYPEKLASLGLDLAVAPLEVHPYNDAKSNLRLLELGVMGYPVICSDGVRAFDCDLPVVRVPNDPDSWISAIRAAVSDLDALEQCGIDLRYAVLGDCMLDSCVPLWSAAWGVSA